MVLPSRYFCPYAESIEHSPTKRNRRRWRLGFEWELTRAKSGTSHSFGRQRAVQLGKRYVTVNDCVLTGAPPAVVTVTRPLLAPAGTVALMK